MFLANGADGLRVVDVHDPVHPQEASHLTFEGELLTVDVAGAYAYVGGTRGAWAVDVHDPAQPQVLAELPLSPPAEVYRIRTRGDVAYVVGELVWTVDVADPSQPRQLGALPMALRSVRDADVESHWLYFVDWWDGLSDGLHNVAGCYSGITWPYRNTDTDAGRAGDEGSAGYQRSGCPCSQPHPHHLHATA